MTLRVHVRWADGREELHHVEPTGYGEPAAGIVVGEGELTEEAILHNDGGDVVRVGVRGQECPFLMLERRRGR